MAETSFHSTDLQVYLQKKSVANNNYSKWMQEPCWVREWDAESCGTLFDFSFCQLNSLEFRQGDILILQLR